MSRGYAGSDWLEKALKVKCSDFGRRVADLLGDVFLGLYHMDTKHLKKAEWESIHWIEVVTHGELATFDGNELTRLVLLAHDRCIRFAVRPCNMQYVRLCFSPRKSPTAPEFWARHPTMEQAVEGLRKHYEGGTDGQA